MDDVTPYGTFAPTGLQARLLRLTQSMPVSWIGRRGALFLRKAVLIFAKDRLDAAADGIKMRVHLRDNVSERKYIFMPQFFDATERKLLGARLKPGDTFVDIGANAGIYSLTAAKAVGENGCVLAIEPNPDLVTRIRYNMEINGFLPQLRIENSCVSDRAGTVSLIFDNDNLGGSSIVAERSSRKIDVPAKPLTEILKEHGIHHINALKIDIEGAEDIALAPFFATASDFLYPDIIIIENSPRAWRVDLCALFIAKGYMHATTTRMNMIWTRLP